MNTPVMKYIGLVWLALSVLAPSPLWGQNLLQQLEQERIKLAQKVSPSVVAIMVHSHRSGPKGQPILMSGVVVDGKGHIVTFGNSFDPRDRFTIHTHDNKKHSAQLVAQDQLSKIAVIRSDKVRLTPPTWGDSDKVKVGAFTVTVGNPFGLHLSVHYGAVSGIKRMVQIGNYPFPHLIQITSPINPGDTGGLVANSSGQIVGIMATSYQKYTTSNQMAMVRSLMKQFLTNPGKFDLERLPIWDAQKLVQPSGIGFVIPSNFVRKVALQLIENKFVAWGRLGVQVVEREGQVLLLRLVKGGPAEKGKLMSQDEILKFNNTPIENMYQFRALVLHTLPGTKASILVRRNGKTLLCQPVIQSYPRKASKKN